MPRIDPTITKEADDIYKKWDRGERGYHTSRAIIEYEENRTGKGLQQQIEELRHKLNKLEREVDTWVKNQK